MGKINHLTSVLVATGAIVLAGALSHNHFNHMAAYCPLNKIFGIEHQLEAINHNYGRDGVNAYLTENGEVKIVSAVRKEEYDGTTVYTAPAGFMLEGDKAIKTINLGAGEKIVVTQGEPIFSEDVTDPDLIGVYNPEIVNIIDVPTFGK